MKMFYKHFHEGRVYQNRAALGMAENIFVWPKTWAVLAREYGFWVFLDGIWLS